MHHLCKSNSSYIHTIERTPIEYSWLHKHADLSPSSLSKVGLVLAAEPHQAVVQQVEHQSVVQTSPKALIQSFGVYRQVARQKYTANLAQEARIEPDQPAQNTQKSLPSTSASCCGRSEPSSHQPNLHQSSSILRCDDISATIPICAGLTSLLWRLWPHHLAEFTKITL